jgi:hypothetical protein
LDGGSQEGREKHLREDAKAGEWEIEMESDTDGHIGVFVQHSEIEALEDILKINYDDKHTVVLSVSK